jgi:endoglucanase
MRMRAVLVLTCAVLLVACSPAPRTGNGAAGGDTVPGDPIAADTFYVAPDSPAARQATEWRAAGRAADADQISKIAGRPQAKWITTDPARVEAETRDWIVRASAARQTALLVAYDIPHRDCGGFSAGGAGDAASYRDWIAALIRGLGTARAVIILEPDAIPAALSGCLPAPQRTERLSLLAETGAALTRQGSLVYLDAGQPGWITDTAALAGALRDAGIARLAGFSLNVSNFYWTTDVTDYGHDLSQRLGGAHFVIDTSRNGEGAATNDSAPAWCNPPGRALGPAPTTSTGDQQLDALLWIKNPGASDGSCRPGAPVAGQWWPDYALGLAQRSG